MKFPLHIQSESGNFQYITFLYQHELVIQPFICTQKLLMTSLRESHEQRKIKGFELVWSEKVVIICTEKFCKHICCLNMQTLTYIQHWTMLTAKLLEGLGLLLGSVVLLDRINKCFFTACGLHAEQSVKLSFLLLWSKQMLALIHLPQLHIPSAPWA